MLVPFSFTPPIAFSGFFFFVISFVGRPLLHLLKVVFFDGFFLFPPQVSCEGDALVFDAGTLRPIACLFD